MTELHLKYFVGHRAPDFNIWAGFEFFEAERGELSDKKFLIDGSVFSEYSTLFMLKERLKARTLKDGIITISHYRRFVSNQIVGKKSNMLHCRYLTLEDMLKFDPTEKFKPRNGYDHLLATPLTLSKGVLVQYANCHHLRDIMLFSTVLIDAKILNENQVIDFLTTKTLIAGASAGTFKIVDFIKIIDILQVAAEKFFENGYKPYSDQYQKRVIGFLLERLHSFLLLNEVVKQYKGSFGSTTMVSQSAVIAPSETVNLN